MKILFLLAATAWTVAIAADDKPKAVESARTVLTAVEHDELTKLFITALSQENTRLLTLIEGKLGVEVQNAATKSAQDYNAKLTVFQKSHHAVGCVWAFFDKQWSCPVVAQSELDKLTKK